MADAIPAPRLFLALWPDDAARDGLACWRDLWQWPAGASPTRSERLHLTLHFIGPVPVAHLPLLGQALAALPPFDPFILRFGRAELWPGGIAVVCPLDLPPALERLHALLASVLPGLGLPVEERAFRPHVTLARKARPARLPQEGPPLQWHVNDGFVLVQSLAAGQGYRVLHRFGQA
jgi:2'-5' RNA ligase